MRLGRLLVLLTLAVAAFGLPAGASAATPVWLGQWDTNWGPLVITAQGTQLTGAFGYADSWNTPLGHLTGSAAGSNLAGTWQHDAPSHFAPRDHGGFTLTYAAAGALPTFTGTATYEVDGNAVPLTGKCTAGPCAADSELPTVTAFSASGKRGAVVPLRYRVADDRGQTGETVSVYRGATRIWSTTVRLRTVTPGAIYQVLFKVPAARVPGALRFTVQARDAAGNKSAVRSAAIAIR